MAVSGSPSHHRDYAYPEMPASAPRNGLLLANEQQTMDIVEPHHNDVLCGRGVTTNRHPGNESFRRLVSLNKELYVSSTKRQKMAISRSIVEAVRTLDPPGRFLDKDPVTGRWSEVGHKKAVEKTSQALRDGAASLRKQLSADLGDPDFLNAVFHPDQEMEVPDKTTSGSKKPKGSSAAADGGSQAEEKKMDDSDHLEPREKPKSASKAKKPKAKEAPVKAKKGHRRTRSNPIMDSVTAAKRAHRAHRRSAPTEPPPSPLVRMAENFVHEPPSPLSPPPRHSASHPNSPMTWGGRIRFEEGQSPGSLGSIPRHVASPYDAPPSPSPYGHPSPGQHPRGGHPYEYRREHPPPYQWSNKPSRYQNYPGHPSPTFRPPPPPTSSHSAPPQAPHSPLPSSGTPLPPGRHKFSPSGYQSNPPPPDYPEYPEYHHRPEYPAGRPEYHRSEQPPPPEWSPRMVKNHHRSRYPSPRHYSPHYGGGESPHYGGGESPHYRGGEYSGPPPPSPRWGGHPPPPHPQESYSSEEYSSIQSPSLSVPALGGEGKHSPHRRGHLSPRVHLHPRSPHPYNNSEIPPRPPPPSSYPPRTDSSPPPPPQPSFSSDDFSPPPPPSPRYRLAHSTEYYHQHHPSSDTSAHHTSPGRVMSSSGNSRMPHHHHHHMRSSPMVEEKKTDSDERSYDEERSYTPPDDVGSSDYSPLVSLSNTRMKRGRNSPHLNRVNNKENNTRTAAEKIDGTNGNDIVDENGGTRTSKDDDDDAMHPADDDHDAAADAEPIAVAVASKLNPVGLDDGNDVGDPAGEETAAAVDDIRMSPLPFDREDPTTLMELPENILTLPISPCGPKDQ